MASESLRKRLKSARRLVILAAITITVMAVVIVPSLPIVFEALLHWPLIGRIIVAAVFVGLIGLLDGHALSGSNRRSKAALS